MNIFSKLADMFTILQSSATATAEEIVRAQADSLHAGIEEFTISLANDPANTLQQLGQDIVSFGLKLFAALIIFAIGSWLIRWVKRLLSRMFERRSTDKTVSSFMQSLTSISLTILLAVLTISTLGVNTTSLAALLAAGGLSIGMALSGTLENLASGLMILTFKPFKAGDYIEAQGYSGIVTAVSIVNTELTTFDNRTITLPNGSLFNGNINNFSHKPVRRVDWPVKLRYTADAAVCTETLLKIASEDKRIISAGYPEVYAPVVQLTSLDEKYVEFTMKAWVRTEDYWDVLFAVNRAIYDELPKKGIKFAAHYMEIHNTTSTSPATTKKA